MKWIYNSTDRILVVAALAPMLAVVTYAVVVAFDNSADVGETPGVSTAPMNPDFVLKYVDPQQALFRTRRGLITVKVGSTLDPFGQVVSIALENGHWTVRTADGAMFVQN